MKKLIAPLSVFVLLVSLAFVTIKAPSDHFFYFDSSNLLNFNSLKKISTIWWKTIIPVPDVVGSSIWNSNFFLNNFKITTLILALISWIIPLLVFNKKSGNYLVFYSFSIALMSFCLITGLHISQRIGGFLLFALLVLVWMEKKSNENNSPIIGVNNKVKPYLVYSFFIIQIISAGVLIFSDYKRPFSNSKNIHTYLSSNFDANIPIYGGLYCNYVGLNNYGDLNLHITSQSDEINYCDWRILNLNKNKSYFGEGFNMMVTKDYKEMIILSPDEYIEHKNTIYEVNKLGEIKGGIINNENAYIYLVKKKNN